MRILKKIIVPFIIWLPIIFWFFYIAVILFDCSPIFKDASLVCSNSNFRNIAKIWSETETSSGSSAILLLFYLTLSFFSLILRDWRRLSYYLLTAVIIYGIRFSWYWNWQDKIYLP